VQSSPWSDRERELLAVTIRLLREHGYDGLTVDEVAAQGRASKATVYRSGPTKAELVLAAFIEGIQQDADPPDTGTLRGDLVAIGDMICGHAREHAATMRAVLGELNRIPALHTALQRFLAGREALMREILARAVGRGEIDAAALDAELWDVLAGYLVYRAVIKDRPATRKTVRSLVDDIILPGLRGSHCAPQY
jgi:AcrR family transcriptional regulator